MGEAFCSSPPVELSLTTEGILFVLRLAVLAAIAICTRYCDTRPFTSLYYFLLRPNLDHLHLYITDLAVKADTELRNIHRKARGDISASPSKQKTARSSDVCAFAQRKYYICVHDSLYYCSPGVIYNYIVR